MRRRFVHGRYRPRAEDRARYASSHSIPSASPLSSPRRRSGARSHMLYSITASVRPSISLSDEMDEEQLENWRPGHDGVGIGEEQPDFSLLPIWTWQLDSFVGEEELDVAHLMQSNPSEPFFATQNLFQEVPFSAFDGENGFCDDMKCGTENKDKASVCGGEKRGQKKTRNEERSGEEKALTFEEVSHYFYMPITQAAKELHVGVTSLKRKCRKLGIPRWPHRKLKSLQTLVKNVKENGGEEGDAGDAQLISSAVEILDEERKLMEKEPAMQLEEKTKRLRQACFKANYKKRRLMALEESQDSVVKATFCTEENVFTFTG